MCSEGLPVRLCFCWGPHAKVESHGETLLLLGPHGKVESHGETLLLLGALMCRRCFTVRLCLSAGLYTILNIFDLVPQITANRREIHPGHPANAHRLNRY